MLFSLSSFSLTLLSSLSKSRWSVHCLTFSRQASAKPPVLDPPPPPPLPWSGRTTPLFFTSLQPSFPSSVFFSFILLIAPHLSFHATRHFHCSLSSKKGALCRRPQLLDAPPSSFLKWLIVILGVSFCPPSRLPPPTELPAHVTHQHFLCPSDVFV